MNDEVKHTPIPWSVITLSADEHPRGNGFVYMLAHEEAAYSAAYQTDDESVMEDANTQHAIDATFLVEAVNSYDRLRDVNADLLAALEAVYDACPPTTVTSVEAIRAVTRMQNALARHQAADLIARARGENVNA